MKAKELDKVLADRGNGVVGKDQKTESINIAPLRQAILTVPLIGLTPLKILRFSQKAKDKMMKKQQAGSQGKNKKTQEARDFQDDYEAAQYVGETKGKKWLGLNATGLRNASIETCRVAGFFMSKAKMSIFVEADGYDITDATPLLRVEGTPEMSIDAVRNASGVADLRARVMFREWRLLPRVRFDEDQFSPSDVLNLLIRVGQQNGLGEGRPNSSNGNGCGNGIFEVAVDECELLRLPTNPLDVK